MSEQINDPLLEMIRANRPKPLPPLPLPPLEPIAMPAKIINEATVDMATDVNVVMSDAVEKYIKSNDASIMEMGGLLCPLTPPCPLFIASERKKCPTCPDTDIYKHAWSKTFKLLLDGLDIAWTGSAIDSKEITADYVLDYMNSMMGIPIKKEYFEYLEKMDKFK